MRTNIRNWIACFVVIVSAAVITTEVAGRGGAEVEGSAEVGRAEAAAAVGPAEAACRGPAGACHGLAAGCHGPARQA